MADSISRRRFLSRTAAAAAAGAGLPSVLAGCNKPYSEPADKQSGGRAKSAPGQGKSVGSLRLPGKPGDVDLAVAENTDYAKAVEDAINGFGGLEHFVKKGDKVILSPNIAFARDPEVGACTHPDVIRKMIQLCEAAGAGSITVMDYTLDQAKVAFEVCGAAQAVAGTTAKLISPNLEELYAEVPEFAATKGHKALGLKQKLPKALLRADVLVAMPVAKNHEAGVVSFSMKKAMGLIWERKGYHRDLHQCLADLNSILRPSLIVMDATRALQTRGPKGPGEVTQPNQVVVGVDPVALDAYCCRYMTANPVTPASVLHLKLGEEYGLGTMQLDKLTIKEVAA
jgi:uncharacterized protein (DUF362 family)